MVDASTILPVTRGGKFQSPEDLAMALERAKEAALKLAQGTISPKQTGQLLAQAETLQQMAELVRASEFVGWNWRNYLS